MLKIKSYGLSFTALLNTKGYCLYYGVYQHPVFVQNKYHFASPISSVYRSLVEDHHLANRNPKISEGLLDRFINAEIAYVETQELKETTAMAVLSYLGEVCRQLFSVGGDCFEVVIDKGVDRFCPDLAAKKVYLQELNKLISQVDVEQIVRKFGVPVELDFIIEHDSTSYINCEVAAQDLVGGTREIRDFAIDDLSLSTVNMYDSDKLSVVNWGLYEPVLELNSSEIRLQRGQSFRACTLAEESASLLVQRMPEIDIESFTAAGFTDHYLNPFELNSLELYREIESTVNLCESYSLQQIDITEYVTYLKKTTVDAAIEANTDNVMRLLEFIYGSEINGIIREGIRIIEADQQNALAADAVTELELTSAFRGNRFITVSAESENLVDALFLEDVNLCSCDSIGEVSLNDFNLDAVQDIREAFIRLGLSLGGSNLVTGSINTGLGMQIDALQQGLVNNIVSSYDVIAQDVKVNSNELVDSFLLQDYEGLINTGVRVEFYKDIFLNPESVVEVIDFGVSFIKADLIATSDFVDGSFTEAESVATSDFAGGSFIEAESVVSFDFISSSCIEAESVAAFDLVSVSYIGVDSIAYGVSFIETDSITNLVNYVWVVHSDNSLAVEILRDSHGSLNIFEVVTSRDSQCLDGNYFNLDTSNELVVGLHLDLGNTASVEHSVSTTQVYNNAVVISNYRGISESWNAEGLVGVGAINTFAETIVNSLDLNPYVGTWDGLIGNSQTSYVCDSEGLFSKNIVGDSTQEGLVAQSTTGFYVYSLDCSLINYIEGLNSQVVFLVKSALNRCAVSASETVSIVQFSAELVVGLQDSTLNEVSEAIVISNALLINDFKGSVPNREVEVVHKITGLYDPVFDIWSPGEEILTANQVVYSLVDSLIDAEGVSNVELSGSIRSKGISNIFGALESNVTMVNFSSQWESIVWDLVTGLHDVDLGILYENVFIADLVTDSAICKLIDSDSSLSFEPLDSKLVRYGVNVTVDVLEGNHSRLNDVLNTDLLSGGRGIGSNLFEALELQNIKGDTTTIELGSCLISSKESNLSYPKDCLIAVDSSVSFNVDCGVVLNNWENTLGELSHDATILLINSADSQTLKDVVITKIDSGLGSRMQEVIFTGYGKQADYKYFEGVSLGKYNTGHIYNSLEGLFEVGIVSSQVYSVENLLEHNYKADSRLDFAAVVEEYPGTAVDVKADAILYAGKNFEAELTIAADTSTEIKGSFDKDVNVVVEQFNKGYSSKLECAILSNSFVSYQNSSFEFILTSDTVSSNEIMLSVTFDTNYFGSLAYYDGAFSIKDSEGFVNHYLESVLHRQDFNVSGACYDIYYAYDVKVNHKQTEDVLVHESKVSDTGFVHGGEAVSVGSADLWFTKDVLIDNRNIAEISSDKADTIDYSTQGYLVSTYDLTVHMNLGMVSGSSYVTEPFEGNNADVENNYESILSISNKGSSGNEYKDVDLAKDAEAAFSSSYETDLAGGAGSISESTYNAVVFEGLKSDIGWSNDTDIFDGEYKFNGYCGYEGILANNNWSSNSNGLEAEVSIDMVGNGSTINDTLVEKDVESAVGAGYYLTEMGGGYADINRKQEVSVLAGSKGNINSEHNVTVDNAAKADVFKDHDAVSYEGFGKANSDTSLDITVATGLEMSRIRRMKTRINELKDFGRAKTKTVVHSMVGAERRKRLKTVIDRLIGGTLPIDSQTIKKKIWLITGKISMWLPWNWRKTR